MSVREAQPWGDWFEISKWNAHHGSSNKTAMILKYLTKIQSDSIDVGYIVIQG